MRLWTTQARKAIKMDNSEFSKLLRVYLYLRVHVEQPPGEVRLKYAPLRTMARAWYKEEVGDADGGCESLFAHAVHVSQRQFP